MALRSLDNALPVTLERPKKQAKVAVPTKKQCDSAAVNDENRAPQPIKAEAAIDYISSEDLKPIPDPETSIQSLVEGLESKDWNKVFDSLNNARRFAIHHSSLLLPNVEKVMLVLVKAMKNPRSALIKTSIMASSDIFNAFGCELIHSSTSDAFNQLLLQLLLKASQDKRFVCEEADRALKAMVEVITPISLLNKLQVYISHANPRIRAKAAMSISYCVSKMGVEGVKEIGFVPLAQISAELLNDRLPEAREAARSIASSIYEAFTENEEQKEAAWEGFCQSNLAPTYVQPMLKIAPSSR